jgi:hypothetical protein
MAYKFIKIRDKKNRFDITDVSVSMNESEVSLSDMLEAMTGFLHACGFVFDGQLVIEETEEGHSNDDE